MYSYLSDPLSCPGFQKVRVQPNWRAHPSSHRGEETNCVPGMDLDVWILWRERKAMIPGLMGTGHRRTNRKRWRRMLYKMLRVSECELVTEAQR